MTCNEFSDQFDTLLNSFNNQIPFGDETSRIDIEVDEYEKSLFLTQAEKRFVADSYAGLNAEGISFEEKEKIREILDALMVTKKYTVPDDVYTPDTSVTTLEKIRGGEYDCFFELESNLMYLVFEKVNFSSYLRNCENSKSALVQPATHDDVQYRLENPFRGPNWDRVLRLNAENNVVEILSDHPIGSYVIRYIREPKPIILTDLPDGLTIEGEPKQTPCELPDSCHQTILTMAVNLALQSKSLGRTQKERQQD